MSILTDDPSYRITTAAAPVRAQVVEKLRRAILDGRFGVGDRLREKELCELTGVSRTSVREALRQLEAEGLVEMIANQGPIVARLSLDDAREVYEVREVVEGLAGRLFAESASDAQVAELVGTFERMRAAVAEGRHSELVTHKDAFYSVLFAGARNAIAARTIDGLRTRITALRSRTLSRPGRAEETIEEVGDIVAAIVARDAVRAEAACKRHVAIAADIALAMLAASEGSA